MLSKTIELDECPTKESSKKELSRRLTKMLTVNVEELPEKAKNTLMLDR